MKRGAKLSRRQRRRRIREGRRKDSLRAWFLRFTAAGASFRGVRVVPEEGLRFLLRRSSRPSTRKPNRCPGGE